MKTATLRKEQGTQIFLPGLSPVTSAVQELADSGIEERGAVFTCREVVDFVFDLVGYIPTRPLFKDRLLEPSFGHGDFLIPAVERLLASFRRQRAKDRGDFLSLVDSIRAVELHRNSFDRTREKLNAILIDAGFTNRQSEILLNSWLIQGDFLLADFAQTFTHVVGNPPYIRQELIPDALMAEYRRRYSTIFDRADIYVPFIERSLTLLAPKGVLGFICSDRWMKNRYGGPLRSLISKKFHLRAYIDMVNTPAFLSEVIAYPAITVVANERPGSTRIARRPQIEREALKRLASALLKNRRKKDPRVSVVENIGRGDAPWLLDVSDALALVRRLERDFSTVEEAGCKVGIGVATGADDVFIAPFEALDVEPDRKLPLVTTRDIRSGEVSWHGNAVINPFSDSGKLVSLSDYPKLRKYLEAHGSAIKQRHVSKKNPSGWYRTIDRIYPELAKKPKLVIPDIKGDAQIVYEDGQLYPHHNLYYITSDEWDLRALQAVLLSGIARLFVKVYSTQMRGGYLRFQAQYLRRIRIPRWSAVPKTLRRTLREAAIRLDMQACNDAAVRLYGLSPAERDAVVGN